MNRKSLQIAAWAVSIALALGISVRFWSVAFPVAAVPFPLTRAEVRSRMESFLGSMGAPVGDYRSAVLFEESTETKNFIERQYGAARLSEAARSGVDIWYWTGRWFKPEQHEEYRVSSDPGGDIVGYTHIIEEERALPALDEGQARTLAEGFLRAHIPRHPMTGLRYLETSTEQKPHRTDYTFVWEADALRMGDAPYHLNVTVQGNEIGGYVEYLKVPEWWTVEYGRQRAVNDLCYRTATFGASAIVLGMAIALLSGIRNHDVRWRDAVPWGWLMVIGVVAAAARINSVPDLVFGYPTTEQWRPFVAGAVFDGVRGVLGTVLMFWLLMATADCIYRKWIEGKSSFRRALGSLALRDAQTVRAMGVGIALAVFSTAYVCVFYAAGQRLGVWCPVEVDFSKTLSGPMPWIEAMQTGLSAAFTEEMIFRVGAVLLLWRIFRVRWPAVLLAAATWGFMHSNYPQMPGYTRGIELTVVGVVWGIMMLRFGVVATLTAHYLYDCWMGSLIALQGASWENKAGAIAVSLWPVGLYLWGVWGKQADLEPEEARVARKPEVPRPAAREWKHAPLGLDGRGIALVLAGGAAALAAIFFLPRPQHKMEELGKLDLSREAILENADAALRKRGYSPSGYERVTEEYAQGLPAAYLLEHGTLDGLAKLYEKEFPDIIWTVRYFRFLQPEEFEVKLDQHGRFLMWDHTILREAPGAELDEPVAKTRAGEALVRDRGIDLSGQQLVREGPIQQEHRRDWIFAFDQKDFHWGDAKLRTYIRVQGDEVLDLARMVKVPDAWILEHARKGWRQLISGEFKRWMEWAEAAALGTLLIAAIRQHVTPWRKAFLYALFPLGIKVVDQLDQAGQFYSGYETTMTRAQYVATQLGMRLMALVWGYLAAVFVIAVALGVLHWAWGWTPETRERRIYWQDTLLIVFASIVSFWTLGLLNAEALGHFWPAEAVAIHYWSVTEWAPWIGAFTEALQHGYDEMIRLAIVASALRLVWGRYPRVAWGPLLVIPLLNLGTPETLGGFLWGLAYAEGTVLLTAWLLLKVWRFNAPAVFLTYALSSTLESVTLFLRKGGQGYRWEAAPLLGLIVVGACWIWWSSRLGVSQGTEFNAEARRRGE